jgi:hypothetical protein
MEMSIEFGSRKILNAHPDLEEQLIVEIFLLSLNQVLLSDISDVYSLQELDITQANLKKVYNLEMSLEDIESCTVGNLVLIILDQQK